MHGVWRSLGLTAAVALTSAVVPGVASAATLTIQNDTASPGVPLVAGTAIGGIDPKISIAYTPEEVAAKRHFTLVVTDAAGNVAGNLNFCSQASANGDTTFVEYRGNGAYTANLVSYPDAVKFDDECKTGAVPAATPFTIAGATPIAALPPTLAFREVNSPVTKSVEVSVGLVPGGYGHEVAYAAGGQIDPATGGISGPVSTAPVLTTTGKATINFPGPGRYTLVAHAKNDNAFTPWSAPVYVNVVAPFDLDSFRFSDSRGPSYRVTAKLREKSTRGKVTIALARGKKKGKYHSVGSARISRTGTVVKRFRQRRSGTYRIRFSFKGSATTSRGKAVQGVRFTRRVVFR